jgi:hypothetical protein
MAEFKTAEQYVVEKLETVEKELEDLKVAHALETGRHLKEFEESREELHDAYALIDIFRDFISVRKDSYWGHIVDVEHIYQKSNPEAVSLLMEYFDMRPEEDE